MYSFHNLYRLKSQLTEDPAEWLEWGSWTQCTSSCGLGTEFRARQCSKPLLGGNETCSGNATESRECTLKTCQGNSHNFLFSRQIPKALHPVTFGIRIINKSVFSTGSQQPGLLHVWGQSLLIPGFRWHQVVNIEQSTTVVSLHDLISIPWPCKEGVNTEKKIAYYWRLWMKETAYLAVEKIPGLQMADERIDNRNKTSLSIVIFLSPNNPWKALMSTDLKTRKN